MRLPASLQADISKLSEGVERDTLRKAAERLTVVYRGHEAPKPFSSDAERIAYLVVRMPATFMAVNAAIASTMESMAGWIPRSMLDLGSGPGTAMWAVADVLPSIESFEAVERESGLIEMGRRLAGDAFSATWTSADLRSWSPERRYEIVVASYSVGELGQSDRERLIKRAWEVCDGVLMVVEPGTPKGFGAIAELRDQLIGLGAHLAAPCPHRLACPMREAGDWCHFAARVERTSEHRRLKQAELGYEDEKFSYVAASRIQPAPALARIVRHPLRHSGHSKLQLCTPEGLQQVTITKSQREKYRAVKRAEWGSAWNWD